MKGVKSHIGGWVIVLFGLAAYSGSFEGPFILDDRASILENPSIRHLWPFWAALRPPHAEGLTVEGRPILNLSLALNYAISGTEVWSYHAVNLLIHLLAGLTLFGIARRTLVRLRPNPGMTGGEQRPLLAALAIAVLWTVHPLQSESVTYVIERAESLMGLFYLLALYSFIRCVDTGKGIWAWLSVGSCFLAAGTKEVAVTLPVVMFLYDRTFLAGSFREAWSRRKRVFLGLAASWILLAALIVSAGGNRSGSKGFGMGLSWPAWERTQFVALVRYLHLAAWPSPLVFSYGAFSVSWEEAMPYAFFVAGLAAATVWALRRAPAMGFLGVWYFGILAVTSLVPGNSDMIAERRMYLPLAAVVGLAVGALTALPVRLWAGVCIALAVGFGALTWRRNTDYRSEWALWADTAAKRPNNPYAQYSLGVLFAEKGRGAEALARFRTALSLKADFFEAHHSVATTLLQQGDAVGAEEQFRSALAIRPRDAETHYDYGTALYQSGDRAGAISEFEETLRLDPRRAEARDNLGVALASGGRLPEAIEQFQRALAENPRLLRARVNLGGALADQNRLPEAEAQLREAVRMDPEFTGARINLANVLSRQGRFPDAIAEYEEALRSMPDNPVVRRNLGVALVAVGRNDDAQVQFERASRLIESGDPSRPAGK